MDLSISYILLVQTVALYLAAAVSHIVSFYAGQVGRSARLLSFAAWVFHLLALIALVWELGHPPFFNVAEAIIFLTWIMTMNYLLIESFGIRFFGVFVVPVVFALLVYAISLPRGLDVSSASEESLWIAVHALISLGGYGAFGLAFIASLMYLLQEQQLRLKIFSLVYHRLPSLDALDGLSYRFVGLGFALMVLGIVLGSLWARLTWGIPWFLDPKGIWSLLILVIYGIFIIMRLRFGWRGRKAAYLVLAGFAAVLFNLFVVNNSLSQFHGF